MKRNLCLVSLVMSFLVVTAYAVDDAKPVERLDPTAAAVEVDAEAAPDLYAVEAVQGCNTTLTEIESFEPDPEAKWVCTQGQNRWLATSDCCCNGKRRELEQTCSGGQWVTIGSACIGYFCQANCPW